MNGNGSSTTVPPVDLTTSGISLENPAHQSMMEDLQANILTGHGRHFAYHIFLSLVPDKIEVAKNWISGFAQKFATSARHFEMGRRRFKSTGEDGGPVFTLSLSATGYRSLGFADDKFPVETQNDFNKIVQAGPVFPTGAKASADRLGDGDPQTDWDQAFRHTIDILIIIADSDPDKARTLADKLAGETAAFAKIILNQKGQALHRKATATESFRNAINIEHFGYADGISQPLYLKNDISSQPTTRSWDDAEPLNIVLVKDPNGKDGNSFGSFLVFRKLEQNVKAFMSAEATADPIKDGTGVVNKDLPGAMMVGRFRNGNVLVESKGVTGQISKGSQLTNDFDYSSDIPPAPAEAAPMYSSKCPFFAHTRITNPRADISTMIVPAEFVHSVRLTRRAIPYQDIPRFGKGQENLTEPNEDQLNENRPEKGVGLLFMSYQAHIGKQFEFIQNNWANHGHIAGRNIGQDGVIGQNSPVPKGLPFVPSNVDLVDRRLAVQWNTPVDPGAPVTGFGHFVRNLGGEYFFTPSISFLQDLDKNH
jgi:Dyp-type peroxidase family